MTLYKALHKRIEGLLPTIQELAPRLDYKTLIANRDILGGKINIMMRSLPSRNKKFYTGHHNALRVINYIMFNDLKKLPGVEKVMPEHGYDGHKELRLYIENILAPKYDKLPSEAKHVLDEYHLRPSDYDDVSKFNLFDIRDVCVLYAEAQRLLKSVDLLSLTGEPLTHVSQDSSVTGRITYKSIALQNVKRSPYLRGVFKSNVTGRQLYSCDYKSMEVVIVAILSGAVNLLSSLKRGEDIHGKIASHFSVSRNVAKEIIFGIHYGAGDDTIARRLPVKDPKQMISLAKSMLHAPIEYLEGLHKLPYITTPLGMRIESVPGKGYKNRSRMIQATGAEIFKVAVAMLMAKGAYGDTLFLLHDEIITDIDVLDQLSEFMVDAAVLVLKDYAAESVIRNVFKITKKSGPSWGELEKIPQQPEGGDNEQG